jgi:hypothetical protein
MCAVAIGEVCVVPVFDGLGSELASPAPEKFAGAPIA